MKKIITILMLVALPFMALTLNSCSDKEDSTETLANKVKGTYDSTIDVTLISGDESTPQPTATATIILTPSAVGGNKVDISLKGFEFPSIGVIPIEITEVGLVDSDNGVISVDHAEDISIELIPGVGMKVPTTIKGTIVGSKMDFILKVIVNEDLQVDVKIAGDKK